MLSAGTQKLLSGLGHLGWAAIMSAVDAHPDSSLSMHLDVGLPPASPSELEAEEEDGDEYTTFLVAAYAKYCCPYVWVRQQWRI